MPDIREMVANQTTDNAQSFGERKEAVEVRILSDDMSFQSFLDTVAQHPYNKVNGEIKPAGTYNTAYAAEARVKYGYKNMTKLYNSAQIKAIGGKIRPDYLHRAIHQRSFVNGEFRSVPVYPYEALEADQNSPVAAKFAEESRYLRAPSVNWKDEQSSENFVAAVDALGDDFTNLNDVEMYVFQKRYGMKNDLQIPARPEGITEVDDARAYLDGIIKNLSDVLAKVDGAIREFNRARYANQSVAAQDAPAETETKTVMLGVDEAPDLEAVENMANGVTAWEEAGEAEVLTETDGVHL